MYVCIYDSQQFETIASFGDNIYTGKISIDEAEMGQINILKNSVEFNKSKPKKEQGIKKILLIVQILFIQVEN